MPAAPSLELTFVRELAGGTFARLYLAEARAPGGLERLVAVKLLREQWNASQDLLARTSDEARLLARLRHRNIVRVDDTATIEGQFAILMEFVDGLDCKQIVEARGGGKARGSTPGPGYPNAAFPARAALEVAHATASALDAAHHKVPFGLDRPLQVVHRDIKPSNLMVSVDGEVKVLDFGTARFAQDTRAAQTREMRFGSLKYMSPERRDGDRGDLPGDMYALGLVLLELLRGEWLPVLPLDHAEHDEAIATYIDLLSQPSMPNEEWEGAFRQMLRALCAADAAWRPPSGEAVRLLRLFADQAVGESLEEFAASDIGPSTRAQREAPPKGELCGRRFEVSAPGLESEPRPNDGVTPRLVARDVSRPAPEESSTHPGAEDSAPSDAAFPPIPLEAAAAEPLESQFWTRAFASRLPPPPIPELTGAKISPLRGEGDEASRPLDEAPRQGPGTPREAVELATARAAPPVRENIARVISLDEPVAPPRPLPPPVPMDDDEEEPPSLVARLAAVGVGLFLSAGLLFVLFAFAAGVVYADRLASWFTGGETSQGPAPASDDAPKGEGGPGVATPTPASAAGAGAGSSGAAGGAAEAGAAGGAAEPGASGGAAEAGAAEVPAPGSTASASVATTAQREIVSGTQVKVEVPRDSVQWMRFESGNGEALAKGTSALEAQVLPGTYRLALKIVGRPVVFGAITVEGPNLSLVCGTQPDTSVRCDGGGAPLVLR